MKQVIHFVRKNTHLKASFIQNQIINHKKFNPLIVFKTWNDKTFDGGFAQYNNDKITTLALQKEETFIARFIFKTLLRITRKDAAEIKKFSELNSASIFHFHYGSDAGIYLPLLKNINIPKVVSFYGYDYSGFPKRFLGYGKRFLKKRVFNHADAVFAMSDDMRNELIQIGCPPQKVITHYYGTNVQLFKFNRDYKIAEDFTHLVIISGLIAQKGHIFLLKAFQKAIYVNPKLKLTIIGEGPEKSKIIDFIKLNNLINVNLLGAVTYASKEHIQYLYNADVFIHPSVTEPNGDKEGIPGAIVEAMASGLPVISTYHAGIPHIIENEKTGLLVPEWDINQLSDAILKLAGNSDLQQSLGIKGQEFALSNLDLFDKEEELEELYEKIITPDKG